MDKKTFNEITKDILLDYGFIKSGKKFYLYLPDVVIQLYFTSARGVRYFEYGYSINALDNLTESPRNVLDGRYDNVFGMKLEHSILLEGYHSHDIPYEIYSEEYYINLLEKTVHIHFDPYRDDAIGHIKKDIYVCDIISNSALKYFGLPFKKDFCLCTKHLFQKITDGIEKEYSEEEKMRRPYLPEEIIWHSFTLERFVQILLEDNLMPKTKVMKLMLACNALKDILINHSDLLTYEAMKESMVWKKALLLSKEALSNFD